MATFFEDYKIPVGLFKKGTKFLLNHISARKFFREILKWLHVDFYDCSCPTDNGVGLPIRWDTEDSVVKRYDPDTDAYIEVPTSAAYTPTGYSGTIVAVEGTYEFTDGVLTDFTAAP